jgi:hypothetical protein
MSTLEVLCYALLCFEADEGSEKVVQRTLEFSKSCDEVKRNMNGGNEGTRMGSMTTTTTMTVGRRGRPLSYERSE